MFSWVNILLQFSLSKIYSIWWVIPVILCLSAVHPLAMYVCMSILTLLNITAKGYHLSCQGLKNRILYTRNENWHIIPETNIVWQLYLCSSVYDMRRRQNVNIHCSSILYVSKIIMLFISHIIWKPNNYELCSLLSRAESSKINKIHIAHL